MATTRDYYEILGLTPGADGAAIDQAYWQLARRYQQEAVSDPRASALLDELNEAYNVLGVPYLRADYDSARREALAGATGKVAKRARQRSKPTRDGNARRASGELLKLIPRQALFGGGAAVLGLGLMAVAWSLGYGLIAIGLVACFAAAAAGAYWAVGQASEWAERPRTTTPAAPAGAPKAAAPPRPKRTAPPKREKAVEPTPARIRRPAMGAAELHDSTAAIRERFRHNADVHAAPVRPRRESPDTTLVEIFKSEHEMDSASETSEPLNAVMEILRGARTDEAGTARP